MIRVLWVGICLFIIVNVLVSVSKNNVGLASIRDKSDLFQSPSSLEKTKNFLVCLSICGYFLLAYIFKFYIYTS